MKKNFLFTAMAFVMGLIAASCSQDEIISSKDQTGGGTVSIAVNIPVNDPVTRVAPTIPDGYKLRCILQLVKSSDNSDITDGRYVQEVAAGSEKVTFTFNAPSDAYKCLFWADYVKGTVADVATDADNIYNTADLKAISYTANAGSEMFKGDVADAFYACSLEPVTGNGSLASITMKRPFTKITFKDGQSAYDEYTKIIIKDLPAPTGFNVMTGETAGHAGKDNYASISSSELTVENGKWFSVYLFAGLNQGSLGTGNDITFELKNDDGSASSGELKLNGTSITLTGNTVVEATVEPQKNGDTSIDVIFPDGMVDPNALAVGDFINKNGTWSKTYSDQAVAIVWKLVTDGGKSVNDAASNYTESTNGTDMTSKTIAGYAFAIDCPSRAKLKGDDELPTLNGTKEATEIFGDDVYGITQSNSFLAQFTDYASPVLTALEAWKTENVLASTENVSTWYIPTAAQTRDIVGVVLNGENVQLQNKGAGEYPFPAQIAAIYTAWLAARGESKFQNSSGASYLLTSGSIIKDNTDQLAIISVQEDTQITVGEEQLTGNKLGFRTENNGQYTSRPVLTIFDGISKAQ